MIAPGCCVECAAPLPGATTVGRCTPCKIAALPPALREVAEEKRCLVCGCPERLHAPLAPWCAGCGAPCPPEVAAETPPPSITDSDIRCPKPADVGGNFGD